MEHVLSNGSVPLNYGFRLVNTKNSVKQLKFVLQIISARVSEGREVIVGLNNLRVPHEGLIKLNLEKWIAFGRWEAAT